MLGHLDREGSWEYAHVSALEDELRAILTALDGGVAGDGRTARRTRDQIVDR
jgi:hypothetical protein